jgi:DNA-binding NarL/FixJ family response regulator
MRTRTYLALISHPDADRTTLAHLLEVEPTALDVVLTEMAAEGTILLHGDGSWHVPPPDITLPARASQMEREALRIRAAADELAVVYHRARAQSRDLNQPIEMLGSREEVFRCFQEVMGGARTRVRSLDRPPYTGAQQAVTDVQRQQAADGVQFLSVYDSGVVEGVGPLAALEQLAAVGEQMRVLRGVPLKMVIADDDTALVIVRTVDETWRGSMLVRRSPLLDSLILLFETLWRLAVPLPRPGEVLGGAEPHEGLSPRDHKVLMLLAGGATDETIARQLGLSTRTVERRVRAMLDQLGAETRFQAGVQAGRRGWL